MASRIPLSNNHYINAASTLLLSKTIHEQVKTAFFAFRRNKSCGCDEGGVNVVRGDYDKIRKPFIYIFNDGIFLEGLKIPNITPIFT